METNFSIRMLRIIIHLLHMRSYDYHLILIKMDVCDRFASFESHSMVSIDEKRQNESPRN